MAAPVGDRWQYKLYFDVFCQNCKYIYLCGGYYSMQFWVTIIEKLGRRKGLAGDMRQVTGDR